MYVFMFVRLVCIFVSNSFTSCHVTSRKERKGKEQRDVRRVLQRDGGADDGHVDDLHERRRHQRGDGAVLVLVMLVGWTMPEM